MTIRERIRAIQARMRDNVVTPEQARDFETALTGLLGNVTDEVLEADHGYKLVFLKAFDAVGKQNRARVIADASPEGQRLAEAKATQVLVLEMIRTLRSRLRSLSDEMRAMGR